MVTSFEGLSFGSLFSKVIQVSTCLYLSKGLAKHVAVLEIDEFFIPKGDNWNYSDVLSSMYPSVTTSMLRNSTLEKRQIGSAESHRRPHCYIAVESEVLVNRKQDRSTGEIEPWIQHRFGCTSTASNLYSHPLTFSRLSPFLSFLFYILSLYS